ncbi:TPA: hypothetical protein N0F65_004230, partial [Lagenidium giganteum]
RMSASNSMQGKIIEAMHANPVAWWLYGSAALLATTMTVGAASKLTRSGASMVYWKPRSVFPPMDTREWYDEYDAYRNVNDQLRRPMSMEEFRRNYKWEYMHRILGQSTALAIVGPLGYFYVKEKLPTQVHGHLLALLALGTTQFVIGRRMVRSNVERHGEHDKRAWTAHGLTYHSAFSLANLSLLLWTAFQLKSPASSAMKIRELMSSSALKEIGELRKYLQGSTALLLTTIGVGSIVASIDAGKEYNTFPKMGKQWIPDHLMEKKPWIRNFYENPATVQLEHRVLAVSTLAAFIALYWKARKPKIWDNLPAESKTAMRVMTLTVGGQVIMGVTMLVNAVPTTLALVHQSGAVVLFSASLWALHTLRFARPFGSAVVEKVAKAL